MTLSHRAAFGILYEIRMALARRLGRLRSANQVVALEHGRVAEIGTPAELISAGGVFARFHAQRKRARGWRLDRRSSG